METIKIYPLGTKIYLTHKKYKKERLQGGKIIPCKIKSYENKNGKIIPICSEIGNSKMFYDLSCYNHNMTIEQAIECICSIPVNLM